MSFNSHKRKILDANLPLSHRGSHLRSCLNHVANQMEISRSELILKIRNEIGIDLNQITDEIILLLGLEILESLRRKPK